MKKIVKHSEGIRLNGVVDSGGVGFLPMKEAGPIALQFSGFFATADEDENIKYEVISPGSHDEEDEEYDAHDEMDKKIDFRANFVLGAAVLIVVASMVLFFLSTSWSYASIWKNIFISIAFLALIVIFIPKAFAIFVGKVFKNKEIIQFSKYLSAKNAVQNAYLDLGKTPNLEEVKDYSCHQSESKYIRNGYLASLWVVMLFIRFIEGWWYWVAAILAITLLCLLESKKCLTFWQALIVSKPSEKHYKVAIAAMEETDRIINSIDVSFGVLENAPDPESFDEEKCKGCPAYDFCKAESQNIATEGKNETDDDSGNSPAV